MRREPASRKFIGLKRVRSSVETVLSHDVRGLSYWLAPSGEIELGLVVLYMGAGWSGGVFVWVLKVFPSVRQIPACPGSGMSQVGGVCGDVGQPARCP